MVTTNNVLQYVDTAFEILLDEVQYLIDAEDFDIPNTGPSKENVNRLIQLLAFYGSNYTYLIGLWGAVRYGSERSQSHRIAARDYLECAVSGCKKKYEAVSRILTAYQTLQDEK